MREGGKGRERERGRDGGGEGGSDGGRVQHQQCGCFTFKLRKIT